MNSIVGQTHRGDLITHYWVELTGGNPSFKLYKEMYLWCVSQFGEVQDKDILFLGSWLAKDYIFYFKNKIDRTKFILAFS